jgi:hypothetical protein
MFTPDIEALLRRHRIEKPTEQFEFGSVPADPTVPPDPLNKADFDTPLLPLVVRLEDEAARVQEIIDIIIDTADEITVPTPPEEATFLGDVVSTQDYLRSLEVTDEEDPFRQRKQQSFEWGVLNTYGDNPHWPILMAADLIDIRNTLLNARDVIEGSLLVQAQVIAASGGNGWKTEVLNSDLTQVHEQMILSSAQVRFKVAQSVFTMSTSFSVADLDRLLGLAIDPAAERIRPNLIKILSFLRNTRKILKHSQLLQAGEYQRTRDAILNIVQAAIIDRLINILVVRLSNTVNNLADPLLTALEDGFGDGPLLDILTDDVGQQLVSVIGGTIQAIVGQYKGIVADLLRENQRKSQLQLDKLQYLGERNTVGRWITHIDQVILTLEKLLVDVTLSQNLAAATISRAIQPPPPSNLPILQRFLEHPELSQAQNLALKVRSYGITPQLAGPAFIPYDGATQGSDAAFGYGDVNPSSITNRF